MRQSIFNEYFGIEQDPFGLTPNPEFFFASRSHATTLEWMRYAVEQRELGLVIGKIGSGKTVISRRLVDSLSDDRYRICWIINPQLTPAAMLKEITRQLTGAEPAYFKRDVLHQLTDALMEMRQADQFPVVIIDEAQMVPRKAVFDELRLLTNYQTDTENLLSILFFGQPELNRRFKHPAYRALLERIRFTITLEPLSLDEVTEYIRHRLKVAGYQGNGLFDEEALVNLWQIAEGAPRVINHLASFSLMQAMSANQSTVTGPLVEKAAGDILYLQDQLSERAGKSV